jgi:hypothetical protein
MNANRRLAKLYQQAMVEIQAPLTELHPDIAKTEIKPQKRRPDFAQQTPNLKNHESPGEYKQSG